MDTPCLLCSGAFDVVVGRPLGYHVIAVEGNAGNSLKLSGGHSASFGSSRPRQILCEKAKAQQFFFCECSFFGKNQRRLSGSGTHH